MLSTIICKWTSRVCLPVLKLLLSAKIYFTALFRKQPRIAFSENVSFGWWISATWRSWTGIITQRNISDISRFMKRLIFSPSLRNLARRSWFERSLLLSWEVAMSTYLVQVEAQLVAKQAGTVARKTRRTRTSDSVVGFMQQRPSRLRDMCRKRGKDMAFDVLPPS